MIHASMPRDVTPSDASNPLDAALRRARELAAIHQQLMVVLRDPVYGLFVLPANDAPDHLEVVASVIPPRGDHL
jgi:hypothetical protein